MGSLSRFSPTDALQPYHRPAIKKIDAFIEQLGGGSPKAGRERFLACLCLTAHTDDRLDHLLALAEDPSYSGRTVGELALASGWRAGELIKILKETGLLVAQAHSLQIVSDHLPAIMQDVVTRAQNHYEQCNACDGIGKVTPDPTKEKPNPEPETCKPCKGKGQVLVAADADRQDRVLEIAKLLPKAQGTQIGISNTVGRDGAPTAAASMGSLFSQIVAATDRIVHPDRSPLTVSPIPHAGASSPIDAEVVASPTDEAPPRARSTE